MGYIRGREGSRLTLDFWLADGLRRQELEGLRLGLGKDDEFSVRLIKCERLREDYPNGQLGMGFALEVIKCRDEAPGEAQISPREYVQSGEGSQVP